MVLPVPGEPVKTRSPAHRCRLQAGQSAATAHLDHVGQCPHLALDAVQAHQRVQFTQHGRGVARGFGGGRGGDVGGLGGPLAGHRAQQPGCGLGRGEDRRGRGSGAAQPALVAGALLCHGAHRVSVAARGVRELVTAACAAFRPAAGQRGPAAVHHMEAVALASRDPAAVEGSPALGGDVEPGLRGRGDRASLDGRVRALGHDDPGLRRVDGAVVQRAAAAVVTEPGTRGRLPDPAVVELGGGPVADRDRGVADLGQVAVHDIRTGTPVEDEEGVGHVVDTARVQYHRGPVADPHRRIVARAVVDLALVGVDTGARVPDREAVATESADGGSGQGEDRTGAQVDRVLRNVVDVAVRQSDDRVGVQGDPVGGRAVHAAVREVRGAAGGDLYTAALDLVHLAAHGLQAAALPGHAQSRPRGVVHAAAFEPRVGAVAHRDAGLSGGDDLALLEHPAGCRRVRRCPHPPGCPPCNGGRSAAPHPAPPCRMADLVTMRRSDSSGAPSSTSSAGAAESWPSTCRSWITAEARTVSGTPSAGAIRTDPADPSGPRSVTARWTTRFSL